MPCCMNIHTHYIIPSDNWEQQPRNILPKLFPHYIIPSDNWEQQHIPCDISLMDIISYQAITGNNNAAALLISSAEIISYQAITGNNNHLRLHNNFIIIISYQAITGNNNSLPYLSQGFRLYHTKR